MPQIVCVVIIVVTILANLTAALADFTRADFALANSVRVGVPSSWLPVLGSLKVAGAAGLLLGLIGVPAIGVAAAIGLVLFFLGAIGVHLRAHEHHHVITTVGYFTLAAASLATSLGR
jgi:DoxX-like family